MKPITTIRSFSLYFTEQEQLNKATYVAESNNWQIGFDVLENDISCGGFAIVEFYWDDITPERIAEFLHDINN